MTLPFRDRRDAGRQLAARLSTYANRPGVIALGLPRAESRSLRRLLPHLVRRWMPSWCVSWGTRPRGRAMGAIASGGVRSSMTTSSGPWQFLRRALMRLRRRSDELARRERLYRGVSPRLTVHTVQ